VPDGPPASDIRGPAPQLTYLVGALLPGQVCAKAPCAAPHRRALIRSDARSTPFHAQSCIGQNLSLGSSSDTLLSSRNAGHFLDRLAALTAVLGPGPPTRVVRQLGPVDAALLLASNTTPTLLCLCSARLESRSRPLHEVASRYPLKQSQWRRSPVLTTAASAWIATSFSTGAMATKPLRSLTLSRSSRQYSTRSSFPSAPVNLPADNITSKYEPPSSPIEAFTPTTPPYSPSRSSVRNLEPDDSYRFVRSAAQSPSSNGVNVSSNGSHHGRCAKLHMPIDAYLADKQRHEQVALSIPSETSNMGDSGLGGVFNKSIQEAAFAHGAFRPNPYHISHSVRLYCGKNESHEHLAIGLDRKFAEGEGQDSPAPPSSISLKVSIHPQAQDSAFQLTRPVLSHNPLKRAFDELASDSEVPGVELSHNSPKHAFDESASDLESTFSPDLELETKMQWNEHKRQRFVIGPHLRRFSVQSLG
jgi:hypothetical protein